MHSVSLRVPQKAVRVKVGAQTQRLIAWLTCLLLLGGGVALIDRWLQEEAGLLRCRMAMQDLSETLRAMRAQAMARGRTVQLRVDATRGAFRVTRLEAGRPPYELLQRTIWLPQPLEVSDAPEVVTALPSGAFSAACILVTAPSQNKRFRLTTDQQGIVQLHEESTL